jgi:hypothetical protein
MNDNLISRQATIDAVNSETVSANPEHFKSSEKFIEFMDDVDIASFGKWQWVNGFNTALVATCVQLKKLPSTQPEQHWIPWNDGILPKDSGWYIVTAYDGNRTRVTFAKYQKRMMRWDLTGSRAYWRVLAWMPLPEPYKEGDTDE